MDKIIQEEINTTFIGVGTDKYMNRKIYIKLLLPKLSSTHYAIRCMTHYNTEIR